MTEAVLFDTAQMRHGCARLFVCSLGQDAGFGPKTGAQTNLSEAGRVPQGLSFWVNRMEVYVDGREPPALLYYVSIHGGVPSGWGPLGHFADRVGQIGEWKIPANQTFSVEVFGPAEKLRVSGSRFNDPEDLDCREQPLVHNQCEVRVILTGFYQTSRGDF